MSIPVDLTVRARRIHTVDEAFSTAEAMAVRGGRVVATGTRDAIDAEYRPSERLDLYDAFLYPGLADPHCHFLSYGYTLQRADLFGTQSWEEVVERLAAHHARTRDPWVQGRGWNQNDWEGGEFPTKDLLDRAFPGCPAFAIRVDGHAAIANARALELAGIDGSTRVAGGALGMSGGRLTGLLLDKAVDLVKKVIPQPDEAVKREALMSAQANCYAAGLTAVSNAGTDCADALLMRSMLDEGALNIRMYAMLHPDEANILRFAAGGPMESGLFTARSFKMYADGALGSRGAWLLEPYSDDPGNTGIRTLDAAELERACRTAMDRGYQMNVHAIGDAAARFVLDAYEKFLSQGNDLRWRIEHAQLVHPDDLPRFGRLGVIPSIQATHATSDFTWAERRLGSRISHAHAYRDLLLENGWLPNGSDFPIERIEPVFGFHAAVSRKDAAGEPEGGFNPAQALTREEALRAMTIWAARANFEETSRGSLEAGKWADFTALDRDLMTEPESRLRGARVLATAMAGRVVYAARPS